MPFYCGNTLHLVESPHTRPIPDVTEWSLQRKGEWIYKETQAFLYEVFLRTSVPEDVIMLDDAHKQGFSCRKTNCDMQFPLHSTRVRYWHYILKTPNFPRYYLLVSTSPLTLLKSFFLPTRPYIPCFAKEITSERKGSYRFKTLHHVFLVSLFLVSKFNKTLK